jgi:hypothetical protein
MYPSFEMTFSINKQGDSDNNASKIYSGGTRFESRPGTACSDLDILWVSEFLQTGAGIVP